MNRKKLAEKPISKFTRKPLLDRFYEKNGRYPSRETLKKFGVNVLTKDLYFVRCLSTRHVKIGVAKDAQARLGMLQVGSPTVLSLELSVPYAEVLEKFLHKKFVDSHVRGEWFASTPELESLIEDFKKLVWRQ